MSKPVLLRLRDDGLLEVTEGQERLDAIMSNPTPRFGVWAFDAAILADNPHKEPSYGNTLLSSR